MVVVPVHAVGSAGELDAGGDQRGLHRYDDLELVAGHEQRPRCVARADVLDGQHSLDHGVDDGGDGVDTLWSVWCRRSGLRAGAYRGRESRSRRPTSFLPQCCGVRLGRHRRRRARCGVVVHRARHAVAAADCAASSSAADSTPSSGPRRRGHGRRRLPARLRPAGRSHAVDVPGRLLRRRRPTRRRPVRPQRCARPDRRLLRAAAVVRAAPGRRGSARGWRPAWRHWFWPLDAEVGADGNLWLFLAEVRNPNGSGATAGAEPVATWRARYPLPDLELIDLEPATDPSGALFGYSIVSDDEWTYLYGHCYRQFGPGRRPGSIRRARRSPTWPACRWVSSTARSSTGRATGGRPIRRRRCPCSPVASRCRCPSSGSATGTSRRPTRTTGSARRSSSARPSRRRARGPRRCATRRTRGAATLQQLRGVRAARTWRTTRWSSPSRTTPGTWSATRTSTPPCTASAFAPWPCPVSRPSRRVATGRAGGPARPVVHERRAHGRRCSTGRWSVDAAPEARALDPAALVVTPRQPARWSDRLLVVLPRAQPGRGRPGRRDGRHRVRHHGARRASRARRRHALARLRSGGAPRAHRSTAGGVGVRSRPRREDVLSG